MTEEISLQEAHDKVKNHPYREHFSEIFRQDYLNALLQLSRTYSKEAIAKKENKALRKSLKWVHDFNACIGIWRRKGKDMDYLISYYEVMLGVIHTYLITHEAPSYIYCLYRKGPYDYDFEKYHLVTEEYYPYESKLLPGYFINSPRINLDVTVDYVFDIYRNTFGHISDDECRRCAESYVNDELKICKWLREKEST